MDIESYFASLKLQNWSFIKSIKGGGQSNVGLVQNIQNGDVGVFRFLKKHEDDLKNEVEKKRFYRELKILTSYRHPNIVEILDYTKDQEHQWYISRKGIDFKDYWNSVIEKYTTEPDKLLEKAIKILRSLADGLSELHKQGIVHRDIKFPNVVMGENDEPILIDFGISFVLGEDRLSDIPIANKLAIDPASSLDGEVIPWLDVYLLSQLLIKMICINNEKQKQLDGPRDWRFVSYPAFSQSNKEKVIALTAVCSNIATAPQDAYELKSLIDSLFYNRPIDGNEDFKSKIAKITEMVKANKAISIIKETDSFIMVDSRMPLLQNLNTNFTKGLIKIAEELKGAFEIHLDIVNALKDSFYDDFRSQSDKKFEKSYLSAPSFIYLENEGFVLHCRWILRLHTDNGIGGEFKNIPFLSFHFNDPDDKLSRSGIYPNFILVPKSDGQINVYNGDLKLIRESNIEKELNFIKSVFLDEKVWEIISR